jgi:protein gp37
MNRCEKTIGWADYTWNYMVGCKCGCSYCAAKRMNTRFKFIPDWENPVLFNERLSEPFKLKKPSKIFVVFMGDLFGDWVCSDWIKSGLLVAEANPRHTFMFLTKNPKRYQDFHFPKNCMLGCTITGSESYREMRLMTMLMDQYKMRRGDRTFVSIEPLLGPCKQGMIGYDMFDLVIIGAETGRKPLIPRREWIDDITYDMDQSKIFYKKNLIKYFPDLKYQNNEL